MGYRNFNDMIDVVKNKKTPKRCAVVWADIANILKPVLSAFRDGIVEPLLIGDETAIRKCIEEIGESDVDVSIIPARSGEEAVQKMIDLVHSGRAEMAMKGRVDTAVLMKAFVDKKNNLRDGKIASALTALEIPTYHKLLFASDGGLIFYPDLKKKKQILENAVHALHKMGISCPKVAVIAPVEKVISGLIESEDGLALKEMNKRGEIKGCIVEGPISYDIAYSKNSAELKGYDSPVAGDADLLIWPNMVSGNIAGKALALSERGKEASCLIGAKIPVVIPSRGMDADQKYRGIALASAVD